jgi:hypothetical protein
VPSKSVAKARHFMWVNRSRDATRVPVAELMVDC